MENGLSASDVALLDGNNGFGGGNSFVWIFGLLILMSMFNGGFGGNYDRGASQSDVQYTSQFGQLLDGNRDIINSVTNGTAQTVAATNQSTIQSIAAMKDAQLQLQDRLSDLHAGQANLLASQNECCMNTRLELQASTASINATTVAQTQKILDAISANRMADMQNQINELQLAQATNGMLRFPNSWTYGAGFFPPIFPAPPTTTGGTTTTG